MNLTDILHAVVFFVSLVVLAPLLGNYMWRVYTGGKHPLFFLRPIERFLYRILRIDPESRSGSRSEPQRGELPAASSEKSMTWKTYALSVGAFSLVSLVVLFVLLVVQRWLPANPQGVPNMSPDLAFNTAASFVTNTNWQNYSGEASLSYFSQAIGLTVQNFVSAAAGMAVALAFVRGLVHRRREAEATDPRPPAALGNFWVDMTRSVLYILLPLALLVAGVLLSQGVVQNLGAYRTATALEGKQQVIPMGPAASQIAIKQLGTNGGGFFGVNSAHPFENPTPVSNFIEWLSLILVAAAFPFLYGRLIGKKKEGRLIFAVMLILLVAGTAVSLGSEYADGTMEGKETRFGVFDSVVWSTATTATSNGSVNSMHDSLSPLSGMVALVNILLGEVIFGGVGGGLYGILAFVIITVFIAGLMVGRSPEYLGKKIESREVKLAILIVILPTALALAGAAVGVLLPQTLAARTNPGPHGLSEILYGFASPAGNNGSAFAGLNANVPFFNVAQGLVMLATRFGIIFLALAIAGSLARKKTAVPGEGTLATDTPLFGGTLIGVIVIIGGLNVFPVLTLGPLLEHLAALGGIHP
jgi:K+-transporting ATPase ATPase A chain